MDGAGRSPPRLMHAFAVFGQHELASCADLHAHQRAGHSPKEHRGGRGGGGGAGRQHRTAQGATEMTHLDGHSVKTGSHRSVVRERPATCATCTVRRRHRLACGGCPQAASAGLPARGCFCSRLPLPPEQGACMLLEGCSTESCSLSYGTDSTSLQAMNGHFRRVQLPAKQRKMRYPGHRLSMYHAGRLPAQHLSKTGAALIRLATSTLGAAFAAQRLGTNPVLIIALQTK